MKRFTGMTITGVAIAAVIIALATLSPAVGQHIDPAGGTYMYSTHIPAVSSDKPFVPPPPPPTPEPTPAPEPIAPVPQPPIAGSYYEIFAAAGWTEPDLSYAINVVMPCESGGNSYAVGAAGERGLMQVHPVHFRYGSQSFAGYWWDDMFDPYANAVASLAILYQQGWNAWACA